MTSFRCGPKVKMSKRWRDAIRAVETSCGRAGLKPPKVKWTVYEWIGSKTGPNFLYGFTETMGNVSTIWLSDRPGSEIDTVAHEYAHAIVDRIASGREKDHGELWGLVYSRLYGAAMGER